MCVVLLSVTWEHTLNTVSNKAKSVTNNLYSLLLYRISIQCQHTIIVIFFSLEGFWHLIIPTHDWLTQLCTMFWITPHTGQTHRGRITWGTSATRIRPKVFQILFIQGYGKIWFQQFPHQFALFHLKCFHPVTVTYWLQAGVKPSFRFKRFEWHSLVYCHEWCLQY